MKSIVLCLVTLCFFVMNCYARCDCDDSDNACISRCVVEANSCVASCKGNIECYESCIDEKWPTDAQASFDNNDNTGEDTKPLFNDVLGTTIMATTTVTNTAATSASASASSSVAATSHVSEATKFTSSYLIPCILALAAGVFSF